MIKKLTIYLSALLLIFCFITYVLLTQKNQMTEDTLFEIKQGSGMSLVARELESQKLIKSALIFKLYIRAMGKSTALRAGEFTIPAEQSLSDIADILLYGKSKQYAFTIVEGSSIHDVIKKISTEKTIKVNIDLKNPKVLLSALKAVEKHPEGLFLADTYYYEKNTTAEKILHRSYQAMQTFLMQAWQERDTSSPIKTPYEALILASIIEKETAVASEREKISGVFINRLRKGMRLQTDPTVIYGLGSAYDGDIKYKDLRTDTPYNTYTRKGLPPTPIAMPGKAAILAALHPEATDALFFVANGEGGHTFSNTLEKHEAAVNVYLKKTK